MARTSHGHWIEGTPWESGLGVPVARCGGPGLCPVCSAEAANYVRNPPTEKPTLEQQAEAMRQAGDALVQAIEAFSEALKQATKAYSDVIIAYNPNETQEK